MQIGNTINSRKINYINEFGAQSTVFTLSDSRLLYASTPQCRFSVEEYATSEV